jgi:fatty acid-binding protein DegV
MSQNSDILLVLKEIHDLMSSGRIDMAKKLLEQLIETISE